MNRLLNPTEIPPFSQKKNKQSRKEEKKLHIIS